MRVPKNAKKGRHHAVTARRETFGNTLPPLERTLLSVGDHAQPGTLHPICVISAREQRPAHYGLVMQWFRCREEHLQDAAERLGRRTRPQRGTADEAQELGSEGLM